MANPAAQAALTAALGSGNASAYDANRTNPQSNQYVLIPAKSAEIYERHRRLATLAMYQRMFAGGDDPTGYDVRPTSPFEDFSGLTTHNFRADWSILQSSVTASDGSLGKPATGDYTHAITGKMPQNQYLVAFGVMDLTPSPSVTWVRFVQGQTVKAAYYLTDLRRSSTDTPTGLATYAVAWGPNDPIDITLSSLSSQQIQVVIMALTAERKGTNINPPIVTPNA